MLDTAGRRDRGIGDFDSTDLDPSFAPRAGIPDGGGRGAQADGTPKCELDVKSASREYCLNLAGQNFHVSWRCSQIEGGICIGTKRPAASNNSKGVMSQE